MDRNKFTDLQERWLTALEGGEYTQGREKLNHNGAFCCLGVATHIFDPDHKSLGLKSYAVGEVVRAFNLRGTGGDIHPGIRLCGFRDLASANDEGVTFTEIAAFIREKPWAVFTNFDAPEQVPE